jgi:hypothetical protein
MSDAATPTTAQLLRLRAEQRFDQRMVTRLQELMEQSADVADGWRMLKADLVSRALSPAPSAGAPQAQTRHRGRPRRSQIAAHLAACAPFPELALTTADKLGPVIRRIDDAALLRASYRFEWEHFKRRSVLREIAARLRRLGEPLAGPISEPIPSYASKPASELVILLRSASADLAADVYAYEHYRQARPEVLDAAQAVAGALALKRVEETREPRQPQLPEPFPGYDNLVASPQGRQEVRDALSRLTLKELAAVEEYERQTRNRKIMLKAIRAAARARSRRA